MSLRAPVFLDFHVVSWVYNPKVSPAVTQLHPDAEAIFKDSYLVDFPGLPEAHSEHQLQTAIIANLKRFLLELGRDFAFVGEQYLLPVGSQDFRLDLQFYHRELQSLIAIELKVDEFKPEYLGKLEFYLEALDRDVRKSHENPSIGVLLCASKDNEVVEYALSRAASPALIAEYQTRLPDRRTLQRKLHEFYELAKPETRIAKKGANRCRRRVSEGRRKGFRTDLGRPPAKATARRERMTIEQTLQHHL
jgi:hypothetical protein